MTLWARYEKERLNREVIEEPWGFISFSLEGPEVCFIDEIYVLPEERKKGMASKLADMACDWAQAHGAKVMACRVWPHAKGSSEALFAILKYGFQLVSANDGCIILKKPLGG